MYTSPMDTYLPERLRSKFTVDIASGCWLWTAALDRHGYGVFRWEGRAQRAHRVTYQLLVGKTELPLDHLCRVHACINPDHLEPVSHLENVRRGLALGMDRHKNECPKGHPMTAENIYAYTMTNGYVNHQCRTCRRDNRRLRRASGKRN